MADKKILILCRRDDREEYDRRKTMLRGMEGKTGAVYSGADYEDLLFAYDGHKVTITDTVSGVDIADHDAIFLIGWFKSKSLDDTARAIAHYAAAHNVPFINREAYDGRSFTKLSQCVIAALNGVKVTPFLFSLDQEILLKAVRERNVPTPYIAKAIATSRGQNNYLVTDHQQLADQIAQEFDPPRHFIVQEFIENDGDYRILVGGGRVRLVIHRKGQDGSHLNNTSQGGKATLVPVDDLPARTIEDAIRLSMLFKREITGVDMVCDKRSGEYYFLETNNMPQLATGSFVAEKMAMLDEYLQEIAEGGNPASTI